MSLFILLHKLTYLFISCKPETVSEYETTQIVTTFSQPMKDREKCPLTEIASSDLALRTFISNLYTKVKDPNFVGSLSGLQEGSKTFARYRDINEDMKKELVSLLD